MCAVRARAVRWARACEPCGGCGRTNLAAGERRVSGRTRDGGRGGKAREWGIGAPGRLQCRNVSAELLIACIALDYCTVSVYNYIRLRHEYILIRRRNCQNEEFFGYDDRTNSASDAS